MAENDHQVLIDAIEIAPDGTTHTYWSTHCRHAIALQRPELHDRCNATELAPGVPRRPAQCKTEECKALCICPCHKSSTEADGLDAYLEDANDRLIEAIGELVDTKAGLADVKRRSAEFAAAVDYWRGKLANLDRIITENDESRFPVHRLMNERLRPERAHLAVLLRTLGVDVPDLEEPK